MNSSDGTNMRFDETPIPVDDNVCILYGTQRVLRTSWTDKSLGLLRKTNKLEIKLAKSKAGERKMKMYLAATWILVAAIEFRKKVLSF
ncbi:hypothetical protein RHSIM_Rhsim01G0133200 [Rhododendron simsii]|uniref:Uncharacterized protein n=1 Tax=Rhododendron simsii TaxID=118357 RepID=A0A834HG89_RHOSS|nr:hypothetical protein RHSIM_Rhsim01G0133200 [Rhododendron simsii]